MTDEKTTTDETTTEGEPISREAAIDALNGKYQPHMIAAMVTGGDIVIIIDDGMHAVIGLSEKGAAFVEAERNAAKAEVVGREAVIALLKKAADKDMIVLGVNKNGMSRLVHTPKSKLN